MSADQPVVLVVEDEAAQREVLSYNLEAEGFRVARAENGEEALMMVDEEAPDIIVLDWMLPNVSGIEVCRQLKTKVGTRNTPVIMLSARSEEVDKVRGLETGADDYVTKPYSVVELMARVRAQLPTPCSRTCRRSRERRQRRSAVSQPQRLVHGDVDVPRDRALLDLGHLEGVQACRDGPTAATVRLPRLHALSLS